MIECPKLKRNRSRISTLLALLFTLILISTCKGGGGTDTLLDTTYTVGGVVSGLTGTMTLTLNSSENQTITADGSYVFETRLVNGSNYSVECTLEPSGQNVTLSNATGTINGSSIADVNAECAAVSSNFSVTVNITGLSAPLVLTLNDDEIITVRENGPVTFEKTFAFGDSYTVTVELHPTDQFCVITGGRGTIGTGNIENITANCQTPLAVPDISGGLLNLAAATVYTASETITLGNADGLTMGDGSVLVLSDGVDITAGDFANFELAADSQIIAEGTNSEIEIGNNSTASLGTGSQIILSDGAGIIIGESTTLTIEENTVIEMGDSSGIDLGEGADLTISPETVITMGDESDITVAAEGSLVIEEGSEISMGANSGINVATDASLEVEDNSIIRIGDGDLLEIESYGSFTAAPGTTFIFGSNAGLQINDQAEFSIVGTTDSPVLFTGEEEQPGYWKGISIGGTPGTANVMDHVIVEYAGRDSNAPWYEADLTLAGTSSADCRVSISNTILRKGAGRGFYFNQYVDLESFSNVTVTENEGFVGTLYPGFVQDLGTDCDFSGNLDSAEESVDYLSIPAYANYTSYKLESAQTWHNLGANYRITESDLHVETDWTLKEGVTIEFDDNAGLAINATGSLNAVGTEAAPITFTGAGKSAGNWKGIGFYQSGSSLNVLDHCIIEYGGSSYSGQWYSAGLTLRDADIQTLTNTNIRYSSDYGLYVAQSSTIANFSDNTITGNETYAVWTEASLASFLDDTTDYTGNPTASDSSGDFILIPDIHLSTQIISSNQNWAGVNVPYRIGDDVIVTSGILTLEPGVTLEFDADCELQIDSNAALNANGTEANPIVFTGVNKNPGAWGGVKVLSSSNSSQNSLTYCRFEYGGSGTYTANLALYGTTSAASFEEISNCRFSNSSHYGLYMQGDVNVATFASNTMTENQEGPVWSHTNNVRLLDADSDYSGNPSIEDSSKDYIYINAVNSDSGNITDNQTWNKLNADYRISGDFNINNGWTIEPGGNLFFESGAGFTITSTGYLKAEGEESSRIVFTGAALSPGSWDGISFNDAVSSQNILNFCDISYGGTVYQDYYRSANLTVMTSSGTTSLTIDNCNITGSITNGINTETGQIYINGTHIVDYTDTGESTFLNDLATRGNTFSDNSGNDVNIEAGI